MKSISRFRCVIMANAVVCGVLFGSALNLQAGHDLDLTGSKPNVIIVMPDDFSYEAFSYFGGTTQTPRCDALFTKGRTLTNFHVSPTCSPSRASLLTGRHEFYAGVTHTIRMRDHINLKRRILPQMLKAAGYPTAMFGKWHLGDEKEYRPFQRGFDEVLQHGGGGIGQSGKHTSDFPGNLYNDPMVLHNEKMVQTEGFCTDIFFDHAIEWMKNQSSPFFVYLTPNVLHNPQQIPSYIDAVPESRNEARAINLKNLDKNMGKLLDFLEKSGLAENTLLVFYGDNGTSDNRPNVKEKLNKGKGRTMEGGIRIPCAMYWKGKVEGEDFDELCGHVDLYPTFAELAGYTGELPGKKPWDGRSIVPHLAGKDVKEEHYFVAHRSRWENGKADESQYSEACIIWGRYKLHFPAEDDGYALYDLVKNVSETKDIKDQHPLIAQRLKATYDAFWNDARPHMINEAVHQFVPISRPFHEMFEAEYGEDKLRRRQQLQREYKRTHPNLK